MDVIGLPKRTIPTSIGKSQLHYNFRPVLPVHISAEESQNSLNFAGVASAFGTNAMIPIGDVDAGTRRKILDLKFCGTGGGAITFPSFGDRLRAVAAKFDSEFVPDLLWRGAFVRRTLASLPRPPFRGDIGDGLCHFQILRCRLFARRVNACSRGSQTLMSRARMRRS